MTIVYFCSILALFGFLFGCILSCIFSLVLQDFSWTQHLVTACMPAAMTFLAAVILCLKDSARQSAALRSIRSSLQRLPDTSDEEFISAKPTDERELLLQIRGAIARFYGVEPTKIRRAVRLDEDLNIDQFAPTFPFSILTSIIPKETLQQQKLVSYSVQNLVTIDELAVEFRKQLDNLDHPT